MCTLRPVLFLLVAAVFCAGCSVERLSEARKVLADIDAGDLPSILKTETPAPLRKTVGYAVSGRAYAGDLYFPNHGERAAMVLVPGAAPTGKDDPRMVAFAKTLARARFRVLVPDLQNLRDLKVKPEDATAIADAALWLGGQMVGDPPLGITAISYAVGPAVAALFEPGVGERVDLVLAIGGYFDLGELITYFTTGKFRDGPHQAWRTRPPNAYGKWVFVESNLDRLENRNDRALLRVIKDEKIRNPAADVSRFVDGLGPDGRAVYALIANRDPDKVPALIAKLPKPILADLHALDLSKRDLASLAPKFFLIHGRDDPIIPETQSAALAAALPEGRAELFLTDSLNHVDPQPVGFSDKLTLLRAIYGVLSVRDAD